MRNEPIYDIAILGAGAAGLMAAISVRRAWAERSLTIAVLEKNEKAGRKLYATGNGRCNLLNRTASPKDYRSGEGNAEAFTAPAFAACGLDALQETFASLGLDTVEEGEGRLYPRSLQAASVVHALERGAFGKAGAGVPAQFLGGFEAKTLDREPDGTFRLASADGREIRAKRVILTSGGKAGIQYGCEGKGLKFAESLGHRIVRPIPALTGFLCAETDLLEKLAGVRVHGTVRLLGVPEGGGVKNAIAFSRDTGEIQFNKDSVSGICVMNVSGFYRHREGVSFVLELDLMPEYSEMDLAIKLEERKEALGDYFLDALLPAKLAEAVLPLAGPDPEAETIAHLLKHLHFTPVASKGWKEAHTTSGGVALEEVDPQTMQSKLVPGLYFAGEILDVDGPCGGYSLTWAFASGWTAGTDACGASTGSARV
ncbi:MAG: aminoacetone oxidase family FAD-binding enzyme [Firmicutes bacterium]|nr:aminoacetone oxidase family FAD-binding enzyme [Bacillota bacterium]